MSKNGIMKSAIQKLIPAGSNDPMILPCGVVCHVAVSKSDSLYDYFAHKSGGIESHFYVRYTGKIEQYRSIFREADAQSAGNSFMRGSLRHGFVSVETEGMGEGKWTWHQVESLMKIINFVTKKSPFMQRAATGWNKDGIGFHAQFDEWNPNKHSCPGPDRIRQFNTILVPWIKMPQVKKRAFVLGFRSESTLKVKAALSKAGYKGFNPNSKVWGLGVIKAYKKYEYANNLDVTGKPSYRSLYLLGLRGI